MPHWMIDLPHRLANWAFHRRYDLIPVTPRFMRPCVCHSYHRRTHEHASTVCPRAKDYVA